MILDYILSSIKILIANSLAFMLGQVRHKDIKYGNEKRHLLDIYQSKPNAKTNQKKPVIVYFHGGGWEAGSKNQYRFVAEPFVTNDFLVVIPDYGKYPKFKFPTFIEDGAEAISWIYHNVQKYGGNPEQIILVGHSAGAHIAGLLATDPHYLSSNHLPDNLIKGFVGIAGAYDFIPVKKSYVEIFSTAKNLASAMPATHFQNPNLSTFLLHGLKDDVVEISNIVSMEKQAEKFNLNLKVQAYNLDHIELIAAFSLPLQKKSSVVSDVIKFCKETLKANKL